MATCYKNNGCNLAKMSSDDKKTKPKNRETQITQALIKSGLYVQRELNHVCQQFGLNTNQFSVLHEIISRGPLSQKKLCRRLLFEKSNISKIVKTLLAKKLINIVAAPEDRRLTLIIETPEGGELWKSCMHHFDKTSTNLISSLTNEEIHNTLDMLNKIEDDFRVKSDD